MPFCNSCGAPRDDGAAFCTKCGAPANPSSTPAPSTSISPSGHVQAVARQPDPAQVQVTAQMAMGAAALATHQRLATSTCPRCGSGMVAIYRRPIIPSLIVFFGVLIMFIPIIGWVFGPLMIIAGIVFYFVSRGRLRYQCPGCNYTNR